MKKRAATLALTLVMLWGLAVPALAAGSNRANWLVTPVTTYNNSLTDIDGTWYRDSAVVCYETGLMSGVGGGQFSGAGTLTYEQLVAVCARMLEQFTGKPMPEPVPDPSIPWYRHYYDYLANSFDLSADGLLQRYYPGAVADRASFAGLLFQTLSTARISLPAINNITALPDTNDGSILFLYNAGILTGSDGMGTFGGDRSLSRAEAAAMLARVVVPALRQKYELYYTAPRYDICADVLQMDPDTVLITVGDYEFTAELVVAELTRAVLLRQPSTLNNEVPPALLEYFGRRAAVYRLAGIRRLQLTAAELRSCERQGAEKAGENGLTANAWAEQARYDMLLNRLLLFYLTFYPDDLLGTNPNNGQTGSGSDNESSGSSSDNEQTGNNPGNEQTGDNSGNEQTGNNPSTGQTGNNSGNQQPGGIPNMGQLGNNLNNYLNAGRIAQELSLTMNPMRITTTPAFDNLDFAAIRERAIASPLYNIYKPG